MNIAFIPARCGSKSIPFKNIKDFCGKPLIYWNLTALQNSENIDRIFVATDCGKIKTVVDSFNFSKVEIFDRSAENANDIASTESVMLEFIEQHSFQDGDLFVLVQATSPLTQTKDFDLAFQTLKGGKADSILSCVRQKRFYWSDDATPLNYDFNNRPRRQDFNGILMENGAFYISSVANIKKYKSRLSGKIVIYEMDESTSVELDEKNDWKVAENFMHKRKF